MSGMESPLGIAKEQSARISERARGWIVPLARFGYAAKGIVYLIIGALAALAAFHKGGRTTDSRGALSEILAQPYGKFLLGAVAVGLIGYALWRIVQSVKNTENKGAATRMGYAVIGLMYAGLAFSAVKMVLGSGGEGGGDSSQEWTAVLMGQPFGRSLVAAVGLGFVGFGVSQLYKAFTAKFLEDLMTGQMSDRAQAFALRAGQFGLSARGVVFALIGFFLVLAALRSDPSQAQGLGGALQALEQQTYAPWLFGLVALGLVAYGLYMFVLAKYRRIIVD